MNWFRSLSLKPLAVAIIITLFISLNFAANGFASERKTSAGQGSVREATLKTFNFSRTLDAKIVSAELKSLGLSENDISKRLDKLSDAELHQFAANSSEIYPGGSIIGAVILTAVILAAAYAYIKFTGKKVVIE